MEEDVRELFRPMTRDTLHKVTLYLQNGDVVTYTSRGYLSTTDGVVHFVDAATGRRVRVAGTVTVEELPEVDR